MPREKIIPSNAVRKFCRLVSKLGKKGAPSGDDRDQDGITGSIHHVLSISLLGQESKGSIGAFLLPSGVEQQEKIYALTAYHILTANQLNGSCVITPGGARHVQPNQVIAGLLKKRVVEFLVSAIIKRTSLFHIRYKSYLLDQRQSRCMYPYDFNSFLAWYQSPMLHLAFLIDQYFRCSFPPQPTACRNPFISLPLVLFLITPDIHHPAQCVPPGFPGRLYEFPSPIPLQ